MVDENGEEYRNATLVPKGKDGYGCLACGRFLKAENIDGYWLAVHDDVDHTHMTYDEEDHPQ